MEILNIINVIEQERERRGIRVKDLAQQAGICWATYYHWCERTAHPRLEQLSRVLDVLDLTVTVKRRD